LSDIAIRVENISKRYRIGQQEPYKALRDVLTNTFSAPFRRLRSALAGSKNSSEPTLTDNYIWALKDVSFDIKQGEVVGIIGRNGSGKTTLLKILSRTTEPTEGYAEINGRVGSLLEVGTGFHPELTGRENIYLNAAILGMKRREIDRKFDEIVAFAETEKFLDTPVKRYSSGMYVRLAFAVAAHLEPEILIVDEVLAVGDAQFQKKCLGKMGDVAKGGRTVLFVSHQMGAIAELCRKALLLSKGRIVQEGDTQHVINYYMSQASSDFNSVYTPNVSSDKEITIAKAQALNFAGEKTSHFANNEQIIIAVNCKINQWLPNTVMGFYIKDQRGRKVFTNNNNKWNSVNQNSKEIYTTVTIPANFLVPGQYVLTFAISVEHVRFVDIAEDVLGITVIDAGSVFASYEGYDYGCVFADCKWSIDSI
jgi:lipopolysaccharide transport system ATP-binding protein